MYEPSPDDPVGGPPGDNPKHTVGPLNINAVHAAAAALAGARGGVKASPSAKKQAAKKLASIYAALKEPVPDSLKSMAQ